MEITEMIKDPVFYFILSGLSVSILYLFSRATFRKFNRQVLLTSVVIMIVGFGLLFIGVNTALFAPFLFIPLYTTIVVNWIEKLYYKKYKSELLDTSFWYLAGEQKSNRDNVWNTVLLLSLIVVPISVCLFLFIFIK